jgi:hypothetical protein
VPIIQLQRPVGCGFLADCREGRRRDLSPAQGSGPVSRVNFDVWWKLQELTEERIVKHCGKFLRVKFPIAQVWSTHVTRKKWITGK